MEAARGPAVPEDVTMAGPWSNCVKRQVCRYLLHHYLGHFFQEHLSLDQLSLDLCTRTALPCRIYIWNLGEDPNPEGPDSGSSAA